MIDVLPPLAFGWTSLPMLAWLAAAGVPIAIHLWSRRRFREVPWAAMQYLLAAVRRQRRRLLLEQYLLLALRTAAIVLVVLAVAEPYLARQPFAAAGGQRTHRLFVLDGSYSMACKPDGATRFEQAKQAVARIVRQCPPGDGWTLVLMSSPPRAVVARPAFEPSAFLQEVDQTPQTHARADLHATLRLVQELIETVRREHPHLARHEVYFLTDLGRVGWDPEGYGPAAEELRNRARELSQAARLVVVDLGQEPVENAAVTGLGTEEGPAMLGEPVALSVRVQNFGHSRQTGRHVQLLVDGQGVQQQTVDLEPGAEAAVAFLQRFDSPGDHVVEARLDDDPLEIDNHRWRVVPVRQAVRVLCVDGQGSGGTAGSTFFLRRALVPDESPAAPVRPEVVPESALLERDLAGYGCVYLCNVSQFTPGEARVLERYLAGGGSLVFFLGDRVLAESYRRQLTGLEGAPRILPAELGPVVEKPETIDPRAYRHPAVNAFRGQERSGLLTAAVGKHFRLTLPAGSPAEVVLGLAGGDPLVVAQNVLRGRVVLVATSADASWTEWPRWPSFLPFVHELLAWCLDAERGQRNLAVGQPLEGPLPAAAGDVSLSVTRPDGTREELAVRPESHEGWTYAETGLSGVYAVHVRTPLAPREVREDMAKPIEASRGARGVQEPSAIQEPFAVNLDTAESDLARIAPADLRGPDWPGAAWDYETAGSDPQRAVAATADGRSGLAVWLLAAALAVLLGETFVAWRQGVGRP